MSVKYVPLRIRRQYFDDIVKGEKTVEFRRYSDRNFKLLSIDRVHGQKERVAVFVCGKRVHRRWIREVHHIKTPDGFSEQGKKDVDTETCLAIYLGDVARRPRLCPRCQSDDIGELGELDKTHWPWGDYTSEEYERNGGRWYCVTCGWTEKPVIQHVNHWET